MLKRYLIIMIIILIFNNYIIGKTISQLGIIGGLGQSFEIDYDNHNYNKLSLSAGLFLTIFDFKYYDLRNIFEYSYKGSNKRYFTFSEWDPITGTIISKDSLVDDSFRKSHYLSLIIMNRIKLPLKHVTPYFSTGPRVDYLIQRTIEEKWLRLFYFISGR